MSETIQLVTTLIGSLGFPIVASFAMFWKMNDQDVKHHEEVEKLSETIQRNTDAVNKLIEHLDK